MKIVCENEAEERAIHRALEAGLVMVVKVKQVDVNVTPISVAAAYVKTGGMVATANLVPS